MTDPQVHFLSGGRTLADQVAGFLIEDPHDVPIDLGDTEVWINTSGAARHIRHALVRLTDRADTGVLSPRFLLPMQAVLPCDPPHPIATRIDREANWAALLEKYDRDEIDRLFPHPRSLNGERNLLAAGGMLCDLCDQLAEGGLSPASPEVARICSHDSVRWEQLTRIYLAYLERLERNGLCDPNSLRLEAIARPHAPPHLRRIVIACVPDLPRIAEARARALASSGIAVAVLVWKPEDVAGKFDAFGRPDPDIWSRERIDIAPGQITCAKDPGDEARRACNFLAETDPPGDYALATADTNMTPALTSEILRRGGSAFSPGGRRLAESEAAAIALGWIAWSTDRRIRGLRRLITCPGFAVWLGRQAGLPLSKLLSVCDYLITSRLAETLEEAASALHRETRPDDHLDSMRPVASRLIQVVKENAAVDVESLLRRIWSRPRDGSGAAGEVLESWREVSESPILRGWPAGRDAAFTRAILAGVSFEASRPGDVEISGWLEVPWIRARRVVLCACVDGKLPSTVTEHPFLPDSRCGHLGLSDNASRLARDACLLKCLQASRTPDDLRYSFSKFGPDGSPGLPSRLLLKCPDSELPDRVLQTFTPATDCAVQPQRINGWKWRLPDDLRSPPPDRVSPTDFKQYLACPFRFYFERVLRLDAFDSDAREMDARVFGSLIHKALELFARQTPDEPDETVIRKEVLAHLEAEVLHAFGSHPPPAVRVQVEAAKIRLTAFARVQAWQFESGWRILEAERKLSHNDPDPLHIGPLPLAAKIDRIERHPSLGIRVVDYKTFASLKSPEASHLGRHNQNDFLPEAGVVFNDREKSWTDLQLPIYRRIAEKWFPGEPVTTAYFILPADPSESAVMEFCPDAELSKAADRCAAAIAGRIAAGVFWPCRATPSHWEDPYRRLFVNGSPEASLDTGTIDFLKGETND